MTEAQQQTGSSIDALTGFRAVYLRAIAQAWVDEPFRAELLDDAPQAIERKFGFTWPWKSLNLKVKHHDNFAWTGSDWVWPEGKEDELTLYVPDATKAPLVSNVRAPIPDTEQARALADYYRQRPSLFGTGQDSKNDSDKQGGHPQLFQAGSWEFADESPLLRGFMPDPLGFLNLEVALLSAVAKAWSNSEFRRVLFSDTSLALRTVRGYKTPWNMRISFRHDPDAFWDAKVSRWQKLTPHQLELCLPKAPEAARDQAIGLAAYNATGAEYPFTCCA